MIKVQILSDSRYPVNRPRLRLVAEKVIQAEGITSDATVSVAVVGNRKMRQLNRSYHDTDATTDVLSFPYQDALSQREKTSFIFPPGTEMILGDLVIAYPQAVKQAREKGKLVDEEIDFLVEHGMQHLLGHHHEEE